MPIQVAVFGVVAGAMAGGVVGSGPTADWIGWAVAGAIISVIALVATVLVFQPGLRRLAQVGSLTAVILVSAAVAGAYAWTLGDGIDLAFNDDDRDLKASATVAALAVIALGFSVVPGLLFYLFERQSLTTLYKHTIRNIFRLHQRLEVVDDVQAEYGDKLAEAFGTQSGTRAERNRPGTRFPLILSTIVFTFGWVAIIDPSLAHVTDTEGTVVRLGDLRPDINHLSMAFIGAYFFSMNNIARAYAREDLRPKTYTHAVVRVFLAVLLSIALAEIISVGDTAGVGSADRTLLFSLSFMAGITPDSVLLFIQNAAGTAAGKISKTLVSDELSLTSLQGMDVYERARLREEGVTNIQALVNHDIVDLIIATRFSAARLADWIDEGTLELHIRKHENGSSVLRGEIEKEGIRTATELASRATLNEPLRSLAMHLRSDPQIRMLDWWRASELRLAEPIVVDL